MNQKKITFVTEQDGDIEREFKQKLIDVFILSGKNVRAYLVRASYGNNPDLNVMLCLRLDSHTDDSLIEPCLNIFKALFLKDQLLDVLLLTQEQEQLLRQVACPFYTSLDFNVLKPDFYLFSEEGYQLDDVPRKCFKVKRLYGENPDTFLLCNIEPALIGQAHGLGDKDIHQVVITRRYADSTLFPISEWPMYVHVARPLIDSIEYKTFIDMKDIELIAWAALYNDLKQIPIQAS